MTKYRSIINKFTVRVYGICIQNGKVLMVNENLNGIAFTKFPGGGLEFGEGLLEALAREIKEELGIECKINTHFYTSDFFQKSAFNPTEQLISVYYLITLFEIPPMEKFPLRVLQSPNHSLEFFWEDINSLSETMVTFPIDKTVVGKLKSLILN